MMVNEQQVQVKGTATNGVPDREAIRSELEATRIAFQEVVGELAESEWRRKSATTAWTIGELLMHLTQSLETVPDQVESARKGKDFMNLPLFIFNPIKVLVVRLMARKETLRSIGARYNAAHEAALKVLDGVQDDEWKQGANCFGEGYWTIEFMFHEPTVHLQEHAEHVRQSLGLCS
jgi:hypothetical protein